MAAPKSKSKSRPKSLTKPKASGKPVKERPRTSPSGTVDAGIFGFKRDSGVLGHVAIGAQVKSIAKQAIVDGEIHIFGREAADYVKLQAEIFHGVVDDWQRAVIDNHSLDSIFLQTRRAPVWVLRSRSLLTAKASERGLGKEHHYGLLNQSPYAYMRDRVGALWQAVKDVQGLKHLGIFFHQCTDEEVLGSLVGMELAGYKFTQVVKGRPAHPAFKMTLFGVSQSLIKDAKALGESVNLARHLVNLDAAKINPASYAQLVQDWFEGCADITVDVWGPERLVKENMHLHFGVGQGAAHKSHMVHLKYRPRGKQRLKRPLAFVGKGVTFDTGGLDIKPASGMRLMKKDMGGSATVVGLAHWLVASGCDVACDLYLGLAENAVDQLSFRPGDVITARNGLTVEIHNTDAEGRLVMADVFDVATDRAGESRPAALIDFSTLTGAMRVAVGTEIAGMFANQDRLADLALQAGAATGDPAWRLPLWDNYKSQLRSSFADLANASDSGFGGAISAALFLQRFVKGDLPWLHFDLYCWTDKATGAFADQGGTGQGVQLGVQLLQLIDERIVTP
jgi:leucyl aminopeptidase